MTEKGIMDHEQLMSLITSRRSIRRFRDEPVPEGMLADLIEAALAAPTASNLQAWQLIVLCREQQVRELGMLAPGMFGRPTAAVVIAVDTSRCREFASRMGETVGPMDAAMAAQNMMIAACGLGLGTCAVKSFHTAAVAELLELPPHVVPELIVAIGWPDEQPAPPPRRPREEVVFYGRYGG